ncbi:40S ribosomal protein S5-1 [Hordeum vulgare]|nr:40S ribosomal protein S5-1 [Hordeum vulgare]
MREGMLHIRDVEGPKKTGSMETRLEAMDQQVFKCPGMVEHGLNANHMMITEFTSKHMIDANDMGKHLSRLYDRIDQLQAQIYDVQNQNYEEQLALILVAQLPVIEATSSEAREEILRVVCEHFPDRSKWPEICVQIIHEATYLESAHFIWNNGGMDHDMLFWAVEEAESLDPIQDARWERYKTDNPSRINIRPPSMLGIASILLEFLPLGTNLSPYI